MSSKDDVKLHNTMDAEIWAREFIRIVRPQNVDEDTVRGWFANAIMCGWDHHYWTTDEYKQSVAQARWGSLMEASGSGPGEEN